MDSSIESWQDLFMIQLIYNNLLFVYVLVHFNIGLLSFSSYVYNENSTSIITIDSRVYVGSDPSPVLSLQFGQS